MGGPHRCGLDCAGLHWIRGHAWPTAASLSSACRPHWPGSLACAQAKRYSHGVRLAKAYELDEELMNLALKSTPAVMVSAAEYLDDKVGAGMGLGHAAVGPRRAARA